MALPKGYDYKPLPDYLTIGKSEIQGYGIFAKEGLKQSHVMTHTPTHYTLDDDSLVRTSLGGWINHSDNPNATLIVLYENYPKHYLRTIRDIEKGEEITLNYNKEVCGLGLKSCDEK